MDANANLWADGFANFGFAGMFAATFGLGVTMIILNSFGRDRDLRVTGSIAGVMAFPLANSALLTTLLTHGLGLALFLLWLLPPEREAATVQPASPGRRRGAPRAVAAGAVAAAPVPSGDGP